MIKSARGLLVLGFLAISAAGDRTHAEDQKTYAERLGWKAGDRVLVVHVDDVGMSHDSNLGTFEALEKGAANSVSVMMPCPWVPEAVRYIKKNPELDAGLHLTLTSEWDLYRWGPLAGKPTVPGLTDKEGCLWDKAHQVVENATPDEVEKEIRAQIDRARTMGFEPTHLDSHMGVLFRSPEFLERYIRVGIEMQIPILFVGNRHGFGERVWNGGLPVFDHIHTDSYAWKSRHKVDKFVDAVRNLKPGLTMMLVHCTRPTEVFPKISSSGELRLGDLLAVTDPAFKKAIEDEKIILTTYRELKKRRDAVGRAEASKAQAGTD